MPYIGNVLTSFAVETGNIADQAVTAPKLSATGGTNGQVLSLDSGGNLIWTSDTGGQWVTSGSNIYFDGGNVGIGTTSPASLLTVNGVGAFGLGSASAPSISFNGDLNTGIYSPGADQLALATSGTQRLTINSSGKLLVGTSTSRGGQAQIQTERNDGEAQIECISNFGPGFNNAPSYLMLSRSNSSSIGSTALVLSGDALGAIRFRGADGTNFITASEIRSEVDGTPGTNDMPGRIVLSTTADGASSPTERMRITSAGNVGIGTANPRSALHIDVATGTPLEFRSQTAGANYFTHVNHAGGDLAYVGAGGGAALGSGTSSDYAIRANQGALLFGTNGNNERARIDSSGRLLVGTSSARNLGLTCQTQIEGTTNATSALSITNNQASPEPSYLIFGKSRAGSLGGVTSAIADDYIGLIQFVGADGTDTNNIAAEIACRVDGTPGTNDMPGRLVFSTTADGASSPTERMRITNSGRVGIGTTTVTYETEIARGTGASAYFAARGHNNSAANAFLIGQDSSGLSRIFQDGNQPITFWTGSAASERARIDSSGRLLVGTSSSFGSYTFQVSGTTFFSGQTYIPETYSLVLNGITNYNQYNELQTYVAYNGVNPVISWYGGLGSKLTYNTAAQSLRPGTDGGVTLGAASLRFGQIYSTSGTISTSDQNAKQDIEPLSEKELRVAKVLKASIKKWKFKDAVIKKGSNARVHIGLIAQEARDAFINENLDPFAYGLLCRDEWWETKVETKNVDGSVTFDTRIVPEGTEGATRCERYAVRYEELLAFIVAAL